MRDAQDVELGVPVETSYLHGGYGGLLEGLERALDGKRAGDKVQVQLEPEDAFGDYDAELVRLEPVERYGEGIAPGMEVEEDGGFYIVTDVAEGKVVLDGNHPLAGVAVRFSLEILAVRTANPEEIRRGVSLP
jgi:FKBP-type peptidyl-prolyl cis-trans isomerase SlyD